MDSLLIERASNLTRCLFSTLETDLKKSSGVDQNFYSVLKHLLWFRDDRATAMLLLAKNGLLWDVDIIGRAFQVALVRFLFLCYSDSKSRQTKLREFTVDLWNVHELFTTEQAKDLLDAVGTASWRNAVEPLMLPVEEVQKLRQRYSNKTREALKQKWSFTGILAEISQFAEAKYGVTFGALMHQRTISSHFVHADETALGIMWDRVNRPSGEKEKLIDGHLVRILSDLLWFLVIARSALVYALGTSGIDDSFKSLVSEVKDLTQEFQKLEAKFWDSQTDFLAESKRRNLGKSQDSNS